MRATMMEELRAHAREPGDRLRTRPWRRRGGGRDARRARALLGATASALVLRRAAAPGSTTRHAIATEGIDTLPLCGVCTVTNAKVRRRDDAPDGRRDGKARAAGSEGRGFRDLQARGEVGVALLAASGRPSRAVFAACACETPTKRPASRRVCTPATRSPTCSGKGTQTRRGGELRARSPPRLWPRGRLAEPDRDGAGRRVGAQVGADAYLASGGTLATQAASTPWCASSLL